MYLCLRGLVLFYKVGLYDKKEVTLLLVYYF